MYIVITSIKHMLFREIKTIKEDFVSLGSCYGNNMHQLLCESFSETGCSILGVYVTKAINNSFKKTGKK